MPRTALIIDNDEGTVSQVHETLEAIGYTVSSAADAESGIAKANSIPPSIILVNLATPGSNGLELCKKIHGTDNLKEVPIILLTLREGKFDPVYVKLYGIVAFLKKPFDNDALLALVNEHSTATEEEPMLPAVAMEEESMAAEADATMAMMAGDVADDAVAIDSVEDVEEFGSTVTLSDVEQDLGDLQASFSQDNYAEDAQQIDDEVEEEDNGFGFGASIDADETDDDTQPDDSAQESWGAVSSPLGIDEESDEGGGEESWGMGGDMAMTDAFGSDGEDEFSAGGDEGFDSEGAMDFDSGGEDAFSAGGDEGFDSEGAMDFDSGGEDAFSAGGDEGFDSEGTMTFDSGGEDAFGAGSGEGFDSEGTMTFDSGGEDAFGAGGDFENQEDAESLDIGGFNASQSYTEGSDDNFDTESGQNASWSEGAIESEAVAEEEPAASGFDDSEDAFSSGFEEEAEEGFGGGSEDAGADDDAGEESGFDDSFLDETKQTEGSDFAGDDQDYTGLFEPVTEEPGKEDKKAKKKRKGFKKGASSKLVRIFILLLLLTATGGGAYYYKDMLLPYMDMIPFVGPDKPKPHARAPHRPTPAPAPSPALPPTPAPKTVPAVTPEPTAPKQVISEAKKPAQKATPAKKTATPSATVQKGYYYVQFGVFGYKKNADRLSHQLGKKGYNTIKKKITGKKGKKLTVILLDTPFKKKADAELKGKQITKSTGFDTAVSRQ